MTFYWQESTNPNAGLHHPTTIWTKWSGKDWVFRWWDRSQEKEIELKLPEEFIVVAEWMGVEWFSDWSVTSNEFFKSKEDIVKVRNWWNNTTLYQWIWDVIKDKVKAAGFPLWKHLHVIFPGEDWIKTLKIKGTAWVAWSDFNTINPWAAANNRIKITWTIKGKKGASTFVTPKFELGAPLSDEDKEIQKNKGKEILDYYEATRITPEQAKAEQKDIDDINNLPF